MYFAYILECAEFDNFEYNIIMDIDNLDRIPLVVCIYL